MAVACVPEKSPGVLLSLSSLAELASDLHPARVKWFLIGGHLKIKNGDLEAIRLERSDLNLRLHEMLKIWLTRLGPACVEDLIGALMKPNVNEQQLALALQEKYNCEVLTPCLDRGKRAILYRSWAEETAREEGEAEGRQWRERGRQAKTQEAKITAIEDKMRKRVEKRKQTLYSTVLFPSSEYSSFARDPGGKHSSIRDPGGKHSSIRDPGGKHSSIRDPGSKHSSIRDPGSKHSSIRDPSSKYSSEGYPMPIRLSPPYSSERPRFKAVPRSTLSGPTEDTDRKPDVS